MVVDPIPPAIVPAPTGLTPPEVISDPKSVTAFDEAVIEGKLKPFVEFTKSFTGASVIDIVSAYSRRVSIMSDVAQWNVSNLLISLRLHRLA